MGLPRFKTVERKYFSFALSETDVFSSASRFLAEGRTRRHERGAECGGRRCADGRTASFADGEVVWSWRAHAGAKPAAMLTHRADDGGNKLVHRGELEVSRKPLRREGRSDFRLYLWSRALRAIFLARGPRVQRSPGLPCALCV